MKFKIPKVESTWSWIDCWIAEEFEKWNDRRKKCPITTNAILVTFLYTVTCLTKFPPIFFSHFLSSHVGIIYVYTKQPKPSATFNNRRKKCLHQQNEPTGNYLFFIFKLKKKSFPSEMLITRQDNDVRWVEIFSEFLILPEIYSQRILDCTYS